MSMNPDKTSKTEEKWIPHSTIVEKMIEDGENLNAEVELKSDTEKANYINEISDQFHKKWKESGNR